MKRKTVKVRGSPMHQENAIVVEQRPIQGGYQQLTLRAPAIAPLVQPGQFLHLRVPCLEDAVLRRPFSIFNAEGDQVSILYKMVGKGTARLQAVKPDDTVNIIGPLGRGFPEPDATRLPVLVAGGYGMAALYLTARRSTRKGHAFFGGRSAADILCVAEFERAGWTVHVATEDGSLGAKGRVTDALDPWMDTSLGGRVPEWFACGPNGMLEAVARRALKAGVPAWISMDMHMGCGVGACLTCVVKTRDAESGWVWARSCREGPVFEARELCWDV